MKRFTIVFLVVFMSFSSLSAQNRINFTSGEEEILRVIIEESRSGDQALLEKTVRSRLSAQKAETLNKLNTFENAFFEAYAKMDSIASLDKNVSFVTEMGRNEEGELVVKTTAYAGTKGARAAYVSKERISYFSPQQMLLRNVGEGKLILSAYNGKMAISVEMNYQDVLEKGLSGVPSLRIVHLSGVPISTNNYIESTEPIKAQEMNLKQMAISFNEGSQRGGVVWKQDDQSGKRGFEFLTPLEREVPLNDKTLIQKISADLKGVYKNCASSGGK